MEFVPLLEDACCLAVGVGLRQSRLLDLLDEKAIHKFITMITAPAFVIQSLCRQGRLTSLGLAVCGIGAVCSLASHALSWQLYGARHPRERAVLTGSAVGSSTILWSFPFAESVFGVVGMQVAVLFAFSNIFAEHLLSYLNFASAGPAFPESYTHQDGATYRGQWNGLKKHGVGTYKYPSGAIYEGEWKDNEKTGRGVYYFKKGGLYEGEWMDGNRNGIGIRTFSDGTFKAGRWVDNQLVTSLELSQCHNAVFEATQAAKAAREVKVGGGKFMDALHEVVIQPITWAISAALVVNFTGLDLYPTVELVSRTLAALHRPLAFIVAGFGVSFLDFDLTQVAKASQIVGQRLSLALVLSSSALLLSYQRFPELLPFLLPLMLVSLAPVSSSVTTRTRFFQLNERLAVTVARISDAASAVFMLGLSMGIAAARTLVPHSRLAPCVAWIGATMTVVVCLLTLASRLVPSMRPRKMSLKSLESSEASELKTEELETLLQSVEDEVESPMIQSQTPFITPRPQEEESAGSEASDVESTAFPSFFSDRDQSGDPPPASAAALSSRRLQRITRPLFRDRRQLRRGVKVRPQRLRIWQRNEVPRMKCRGF